MRRKMDEEGYLPVTLIASFHRVQALTNDVTLVVSAISESDKLEMLGGFKVCLILRTTSLQMFTAVRIKCHISF